MVLNRKGVGGNGWLQAEHVLLPGGHAGDQAPEAINGRELGGQAPAALSGKGSC